MWLSCEYHAVIWTFVLLLNYHKCIAITNPNANFNAQVRAYSEAGIGENDNLTIKDNIKTLQTEPIGRHTELTPIHTPIKFKELSDSTLSSSSRGLSHYDRPVYSLSDYDEHAHYNPGHEYQLHDHQLHVGPQEYHFEHSVPHHTVPHHISYGHHHKHYNHALAAKTILWPIAGIALLGAAAALVSNPILLQLGVVSGRRRRDTKTSSTTPVSDSIKKPDFFVNKISTALNVPSIQDTVQIQKNNRLELKTVERNARRVKRVKATPLEGIYYPNRNDDDGFIPIPLQIRGKELEKTQLN